MHCAQYDYVCVHVLLEKFENIVTAFSAMHAHFLKPSFADWLTQINFCIRIHCAFLCLILLNWNFDRYLCY